MSPCGICERVEVDHSRGLSVSVLISGTGSLMGTRCGVAIIRRELFGVTLSGVHSGGVALSGGMPVAVSTRRCTSLFSSAVSNNCGTLEATMSALFRHRFALRQRVSGAGGRIEACEFVRVGKCLRNRTEVRVRFTGSILPFMDRLTGGFARVSLRRAISLDDRCTGHLCRVLGRIRGCGRRGIFLRLSSLQSEFNVRGGCGAVSGLGSGILSLTIARVGGDGTYSVCGLRCAGGGTKGGVVKFRFACGVEGRPGGSSVTVRPVILGVASSRHCLFTGGLSRLTRVGGCSRNARGCSRFTIHVTRVLRSPLGVRRLLPCLGGMKFGAGWASYSS